MAKVTPSALITEIKGKWNGSCFQMWKGAITIRRSPKPRKIISESRYNFRAVISSLSGCFYIMTPNQRIAWNDYAKLLPRSASGYNAFISRSSALVLSGHPDLCAYYNAPVSYNPPVSAAPIGLCYYPDTALYCISWNDPNCASVYVQGLLAVQSMYSNENCPKWKIFDTVPSTDLHMIYDASSFDADQMIRFTARSINMRGEFSATAEAKPPPPLPESVSLLYPIGGESLYFGKYCLIRWRSKSTPAVSLYYSLNNGVDYSLITDSISSYSGSYNWLIPSIESSECLVKIVSSSNPDILDVSDSVFSIKKYPTLTLTAPNGGETWSVGEKKNITWSSFNVSNVKLLYSINAGQSYSTIVSSTPAATGSYEWTVPDSISSSCVVKIICVEDISIFDVSNSYFSIIASQLPDGCIARWIFKTAYYDSDNTRFVDQTGNEHHAVNVNGSVTDNYTQMNGTSSQLQIPDFFELSENREHLSVFTWINGPANDGGVFEHWYVTNWSVCWEIHYTNGDLWFIVTNVYSASTFKQYRITCSVMDDTPHSVGFTFNSGILKLFIDGIETEPTFVDRNDSFTTLLDSTQPYRIAYRYSGSTGKQFLETKLYSSYIYSKTLTPAEMLSLHNIGI